MSYCKGTSFAAGAAIALSATGAWAQIAPDPFAATVMVGEATSEMFTVTVPEEGPATSLVDVVFLADNTGSVGPAIADVKSEAASLLGTLSGTAGLDIQFGVASYFGDPVEGVTPGNPDVGGNSSSFALNLITPVTGDLAAVEAGIDAWIASGGGDGPEGGLFALEQIAAGGTGPESGIDTGLDVGFRDLARSIVVWFGDIGQHTDTIGLDETIGVLSDAMVTVNAISFGGLGLDGGGDPPGGQGTAIAEATGGISADADASGVAEAILDSITTTIETIDLALVASETFAGLGVEIACVDMLGCDGVEAGESRSFDATFTGVSTGTYDFDLLVPGLDGTSADVSITVGDEDGIAPIPLPAGAWLMAAGLAGLGGLRLRRR